jgi:hypothetical protein
MLPVLGQAECKFLSGGVELIGPSFKNMNRWNLLTHTVPRTVLFQKKDVTMLIVCFHTWLRFWFWIHINLSCYLLIAEIVKQC